MMLSLRSPSRGEQGDIDLQMHCLKQAAEETQMSFLSEWFPSAGDNKTH
jgi:hypothetical protein